MWQEAKAILKEKFIASNAYIRGKNVLSESSTEKFEKEQQSKPRDTGGKVKITKTNEIENTNRNTITFWKL